MDKSVNDSVHDESVLTVAAAFGAGFTIIAGTEGKPLSYDYYIRIRETGVRASRSTPAMVVKVTENLQDHLAGLDSEASHEAMKKFRGIVRTCWGARMALPYDPVIRGTEVSLDLQ
jgi:hypothetical protein